MPKGETKKEILLNNIFMYANKHRGDTYAAEVLMSFFRGECQHMLDERGKCELCATFLPARMRS